MSTPSFITPLKIGSLTAILITSGLLIGGACGQVSTFNAIAFEATDPILPFNTTGTAPQLIATGSFNGIGVTARVGNLNPNILGSGFCRTGALGIHLRTGPIR